MKEIHSFYPLIRWAAVVLWPILSLQAAIPDEWRNTQKITINQSGMVRFDVPLDTLSVCRPGLEDLRLLDSEGKEMSFLLQRSFPDPDRQVALKNFRISMQNQQTIVSATLSEASRVKTLSLETPEAEFLKPVILEISEDGRKWNTIVRGEPIFRMARHGVAKTQLELAEPLLVKELRLTVDDRKTSPIAITGLTLFIKGEAEEESELMPVQIQEQIEGPESSKVLLKSAAANVQLQSLHIETDEPFFQRSVALNYIQYQEDSSSEVELARNTIYRMAVNGVSEHSSLLVAKHLNLPAGDLLLTVYNYDNAPLKIRGIRAYRYPLYLVFAAPRAGDYYLFSGNARCAAPRYGLQMQSTQLKNIPRLAINAGPIAANSSFKQIDALPVSTLGAAIDIGAWGFRKRVQQDLPGVHLLELDPQVMGRLRSDFSSLRLVQTGRQVPFILANPMVERALKLNMSPDPDPKRPSVGRYKITLPVSGLKISRLSFKTDLPFFERQITLWENALDHQGTERWVRVGESQWVRRLNQTATPLYIGFSGGHIPASDCLWMEIENGDNAPLPILEPQLFYAPWRLLYKVDQADNGTFLYYFNALANTPKYDLSLVLPELQLADKLKTQLGPEEALKKRYNFFADWDLNRSWAVWISLVVVVIGLLWVLKKLLPPASPEQKA